MLPLEALHEEVKPVKFLVSLTKTKAEVFGGLNETLEMFMRVARIL